MKRTISHFCIHVSNMENAVSFYRDTMGFVVEYQSADWSELKLNDSINLALQRSAQAGTGIGFAVEDCAKATAQLEEKGAKVVARCVQRAGDDFVLTQFEDADGNVLWLSQQSRPEPDIRASRA